MSGTYIGLPEDHRFHGRITGAIRTNEALFKADDHEAGLYIAQAVMHYDTLLAALKAVTNDYDPTGCEDCGVIGGETIDLVNAAIAKQEF